MTGHRAGAVRKFGKATWAKTPRAFMSILVAAAAGFSVAVLASSAASAQDGLAALGGTDQPFTVGLQDVTGFETNPARGNSVNAQIRNIHPDEVINSPSVTAVYSHTLGQAGVALNGNFGYDYHSKNAVLDREHLVFSVVGNNPVGSLCSLGGNGAFSQTQSDLQQLTVDVTQNTVQTYSVGGSERCATATGLTESVSVFRTSMQNSNALLIDTSSTGVSALVGYSNTLIGTAGVTMSYVKSDNGQSTIAPDASPSGLQSTSVGLSLERPIGARLTGSASVSYSRSTELLRPGAPASLQSSFGGLVSLINLSYTVGPRLLLSTNLSRRVSATQLAGVGYSVITSAGLGATYTVSSRISANLSGNWADTTNNGRDTLVFVTTPYRQDTTSVNGSISSTIGRRAAVSLNVRYTNGGSTVSLYQYSSEYIGLSLSASL